MHRCAPGGIRTPDPSLRRAVRYPATLRAHGSASTSRIRRRACARDVLEKIEFMVHERAIELAHAVGVSKEVRSRVCQIFAGAIRHVVRDFDLLHLSPVDRMGAEVAWNRRHDFDYLRMKPAASAGAAGPRFFWLG